MVRVDSKERDARDDNMYEWARQGKFTDVEFAAGGRTFCVHRVVVCAASQYFDNMLTSQFLEAQAERPIPLEDISATTFDMVLCFLYTGAVDAQPHMDLCELLRVADRYCLPEMVKLCITVAKDGQLAPSNCLQLLDVACTLGDHGRDPLWLPLTEACAAYAVPNLPAVLDTVKDGEAPQLALAGMCRLVELAIPAVEDKPLLLLRFWRFVRAWGRSTLGADDLKTFVGKVDWTFEEAGFLDATEDILKFADIDVGDSSKREWPGQDFQAGGYMFKVSVTRAWFEEAQDNDWYSVWVKAASRLDGSLACGCMIMSHITWLRSSAHTEQEQPNHKVQRFQPPDLWLDISHSLQISKMHDVEGGYLRDREASLRVQLKINSLFNLCTMAALMDNLASPVSALLAFRDPNILHYMLSSDRLPIESEQTLLVALSEFANARTSEIDDEDIAVIVPALRLEHMDFGRLIDAVKACPLLRRCQELEEMLAYRLGHDCKDPSAKAPPQRCSRGAVWRLLQGQAAVAPPSAAQPPEEPAPEQLPPARALVRSLLRAGADDREPEPVSTSPCPAAALTQATELLARSSRQAEGARAAVRALVCKQMPPAESALRLQVQAHGIASVVYDCLPQKHLEALACPDRATAARFVLAAAYVGALAGAAERGCEVEKACGPGEPGAKQTDGQDEEEAAGAQRAERMEASVPLLSAAAGRGPAPAAPGHAGAAAGCRPQPQGKGRRSKASKRR